MHKVSKLIVTLVAILHIYFLWFEMFAWTSRGPEIFKSFPPELFDQTIVMAANQGLYNGFLAAGLIWSLFITDFKWQRKVCSCFLIFVLVAGIYGAFSVDLKVLFVQAFPAALGLLCLFLLRRK